MNVTRNKEIVGERVPRASPLVRSRASPPNEFSERFESEERTRDRRHWRIQRLLLQKTRKTGHFLLGFFFFVSASGDFFMCHIFFHILVDFMNFVSSVIKKGPNFAYSARVTAMLIAFFQYGAIVPSPYWRQWKWR